MEHASSFDLDDESTLTSDNPTTDVELPDGGVTAASLSTAADRHLACIATLRPRVASGEVKLVRNRYGKLDVVRAAVDAGIPRSAAYIDKIRDALEELADTEGAAWAPDVRLVRSPDAFARPLATEAQLDEWRLICAAHDIAFRQEEVDRALDELVLWNADLDANGGTVPWS